MTRRLTDREWYRTVSVLSIATGLLAVDLIAGALGVGPVGLFSLVGAHTLAQLPGH